MARHPVSHGGCKIFSLALSKLEREIGENAQDEDWRWILRILKIYRFEVTAAPLPFSDKSLERVPIEEVQERFARSRRAYPQFARSADEILKLFKDMRKCRENPMKDLLSQSILKQDPQAHIGIVVKEVRLIEPVEQELEGIHSDLDVLSHTQLRGKKCFDRLIIIGPARWFSSPDHLFRSPRGKRLELVYFRWLADDWHLGPAFTGCSAPGPRWVEEMGQESFAGAGDGEFIKAQDAVPQIDWSHLVKPFRGLTADTAQENVKGQLFLLDGGSAVFLEAEEDATSLVIDLEADDDATVKRLPVTEIHTGMFVLLRTTGGGDLIIPVADRILGDRAIPLRKLQAEWKEKLRSIVEQSTYLEASIKLLDLGAERANETNLRNWISPRSIKTQDQKDFMAMMKLTGLEKAAGGIWEAMSEIDSAHRRAGATIRRMLMKRVRETDLKELLRKGQMTFELSDEGGGSLTAYRVTEIAPQLAVVPASKLSRIFSQTGQQWQE